MKTLKLFVLLLWLGLQPALAAPLPRGDLPDALKPWLPWVLQGHEAEFCPGRYDQPGERACDWPALLELDLSAGGGTFALDVQVSAAGSFVALPGQDEAWPQDVRAGNTALAVVAREGRPGVLLAAGRQRISGRWIWSAPPAQLQLPAATGLLQARLEGRPLAPPDVAGNLWLRADAAGVEGADTQSLRIFRRIDDDLPTRITTRMEIAVSGKAREFTVPGVLPPGYTPLALSSELPAHFAPGGALVLKLRAGNWIVSAAGRRTAPLTELALAEGSPDEIWSVAAYNDLRLSSVEGPPVIDPGQAGVPAEWARLPAYRMSGGQSMKFVERRRGDPDPAPDKLALERTLWLDFDGAGYTLQDRLSGSISRSWRLEMAPPVTLGRVASDGRDQFITRLNADAPSGIEVRQGEARISADSRIDAPLRTLPASGWQADFQRATVDLRLPPGWRLLAASGADYAQGAWIAQWTLWDFFFVLLASVAALRLFGKTAAAVLALALALSWHLPGSPGWPWLAVLAFAALSRAAPPGKLASFARWGGRAAALALLLMWLPFALQQIRQAIYPALEFPYLQSNGAPAPQRPMAAPAPAAEMDKVEASNEMPEAQAEAAPQAAGGVVAAREMRPDLALRRKAAQIQANAGSYASSRESFDAPDPKARVQTGPGLPSWRWRSHNIGWQGPVERAQELRLWLLPPWATRALEVLVVLASALAGWLLLGRPRPPAGLAGRAAAGATLCALLGALGGAPEARAEPARPPTGAAAANLPDADLLQEMRERLTAPDCTAPCAEIARLALLAEGGRVQLRLEIHTQADIAVPLPGAAAWRPNRVLLENRTPPLRRDAAGTLWVLLPRGVHEVLLEQTDAPPQISIALPMPPRELRAQLSGWSMAGVDARGLASGALTLARTESARGTTDTRADEIPPLLRVTRTLQLGQTWRILTRVARMGGGSAPVEARVRLVAGEAVTDPSVRVAGGIATLTLGPGAAAEFGSSVAIASALELQAENAPDQVETWTLDAAPQWNVQFSGLVPVARKQGARWLPQWQPFPGEKLSIAVLRPQGVDGQTLTTDALSLRVRPGLRATDVSAQFTLRASQGGNHRVQIPPGAQLLSFAIDGRVQPQTLENGAVTLPLVPGSQSVALEWREARGMAARFELGGFDPGAPGANSSLSLELPRDRWLLWTAGPALGPAVLFWGILPILLAAAWAAARSRIAPLGFGAWFLLALGLGQANFVSLVVVFGFLLALGLRARHGPNWPRWAFNLAQLALALWALLAVGALFEAVRGGLLGQPDMHVAGNGSSAHLLNWYTDRVAGATPSAWVLSVPIWIWRALMLVWALWLAAGVLRWTRWAWDSYASGGLWRRGPPRGPKKPLFGRRRTAAEPAPAEQENATETSPDPAPAESKPPDTRTDAENR
ncbi:MAG: hypothetical protein JNM98_10140 [Rhodocyclaceae bacterium]|nr:hypothetical protein [Rhodocyclaceae bacterium]